MHVNIPPPPPSHLKSCPSFPVVHSSNAPAPGDEEPELTKMDLLDQIFEGLAKHLKVRLFGVPIAAPRYSYRHSCPALLGKPFFSTSFIFYCKFSSIHPNAFNS